MSTPAQREQGYQHPKTLEQFEEIYRTEYEQDLALCDRWIRWCKKQNDFYGVNFYEGMRAAHVFNNIKMGQVIRILKKGTA